MPDDIYLMTRRTLHTITATLMLLLSTLMASAQAKTEVSARVDRDSILIGEPIELVLEADIPENAPIRFFPIDTIPHFEFLEMGMIDTSNTSEGTFLRRVMRITSFDSGHWVIPSLSIGEGIRTDSIPVDVGYSDFDRNQDYHDVKDILEVSPEEKERPWWWYLVGVGLMVLLVAFIYFLKKKKPVVEAAQAPVDAYREAMGELSALETAPMERKLFYTRMVDIFRLYVYRKKGVASLQKTTDDLVIRIRELGMPKTDFDSLSQALRLSDYVKFAKYVPSEADDRSAFEAIKKAIEDIEKIN